MGRPEQCFNTIPALSDPLGGHRLPDRDSTIRLIPLTQGQFAIVDAADFDYLNQWKWHACKVPTGYLFAQRVPVTNGKRGNRILMHRLILKAPVGSQVRHSDGNGLNNCRSNLILEHGETIIQPTGDFRLIQLTQGKVATVDVSDFEHLNRFKWHAVRSKSTDVFYAKRTLPSGESGETLMHREILAVPKGVDIDHKDGDGLNNRRSNLRIATKQQNIWNRGPQRNTSSGYKGVTWHKASKRWRANLTIDKKLRHLGTFKEKEEAIKVYEAAAEKLQGEFMRKARVGD